MVYNFIKHIALAASFSLLAVASAQAQTAAAPAAKKAAPASKPTEPVKSTAPAKSATVDLGKSSVSAVFKQTGVSTEGVFEKFAITATFDPAKITETQARIEVDMKSYDIGDAAYNEEIQNKDWFNVTQYPKASFVSTSVKVVATGKLEIAGKLSIKGKVVDVTIPVTYKQEGANTVFEGSLPIKRLTFNIGEGLWKDTSVVEDNVLIKFKVTLASK